MPNPQNVEKHRYKKGQTGNPQGRPSIPPLNKLLAECCTELEMTKVIKALVKRAQSGNTRACEILLDRLYGRTPATIDFTSDDKTSRFDFAKVTTPTLQALAELQERVKAEILEYDKQHGNTTSESY